MFSQERKDRAQLERLLREFPWLWGINRDWRFLDTVQVQSISISLLPLLSRRIFFPYTGGESWWVKLSSGDFVHPLGFVRELDLIHNTVSLAEKAIRTIEEIGYNKIEFLVFVRPISGKTESSKSITIYRAPRGQNLHQMCCEAAGIRAKS